MKPRVLGENGKFTTFKGKRILTKIKSPAQKDMERKKSEHLATAHGISVEGPIEGGLSENDKILVRSGELTLQALLALAELRMIALPKGLASKKDVTNAILKEEKVVKTEAPVVTTTIEEVGGPEFTAEEMEALKKGMSIPEMKDLAKKYKINLQGKKLSADIRAILLNEEVDATADGSDEL